MWQFAQVRMTLTAPAQTPLRRSNEIFPRLKCAPQVTSPENKANENYPPNLHSDVCIYLLAANHSESLTAIVAARKISAELNSIVSFSKHENAN